MAKKTPLTQHLVDCEECQYDSAKYVCKTCPKQLCVQCKARHENGKLTKDHDISEIITNKHRDREPLYCPKHKSKKLKCFCISCEKPVCKKCITESHNGHTIQKLSRVYEELKKDWQKQKEEIEDNLLPKYTELLKTEHEKRSTLSKQAEENKRKIKAHTRDLVKMIKEMRKDAIRDLEAKEKEGLRGIDASKAEIESKIDKLQQIKLLLIENMKVNPKFSFLKSANSNLLDEFQRLPVPAQYKLLNFQPGKIDEKIKSNYGRLPDLEINAGKPLGPGTDSESSSSSGSSIDSTEEEEEEEEKVEEEVEEEEEEEEETKVKPFWVLG